MAEQTPLEHDKSVITGTAFALQHDGRLGLRSPPTQAGKNFKVLLAVRSLLFGAVAGYYLGSHYSQRIPQKYVRHIITAIGFIISAVTFYKEFLR